MKHLNQLRVYKNKVHIANVPTGALSMGIAQVPMAAIVLMCQFVRGETATTRYEQWSWEWQEIPKEIPAVRKRLF